MPYNPAIHHRRSIRLKGYDYSQSGIYFVTICVQNHECVFGNVINGEMILNEYGQIAYNEWIKTLKIRSNVQLGAFVVMPNHVHGIIRMGVLHTPQIEMESNRMGILHTPQIEMESNRTGVLHTPQIEMAIFNRGVCDTPLRSPSNTVGAIVRGYKSAVTKQLKQFGFHNFVWQRNYHEHIIRNEQSYQYIANYIINNPAKWENDKFHAK